MGASYKKLWTDDIYPYRILRNKLPMVLVGHANYPSVTKDPSPASLSRKWITDVLRKKIGYRGLVVSDDMEMGGVLKAAPIGPATVEFVRAGGDLALICRQEDFVVSAYESLVKEAENDLDSPTSKGIHHPMLAFKRKSRELKKRIPEPTPETTRKLKQQLADLAEQIRQVQA